MSICFVDQNINRSIAGQWTEPNKIVAQKAKNIYREIRIKFDYLSNLITIYYLPNGLLLIAMR